jgi:hypothetical protein
MIDLVEGLSMRVSSTSRTAPRPHERGDTIIAQAARGLSSMNSRGSVTSDRLILLRRSSCVNESFIHPQAGRWNNNRGSRTGGEETAHQARILPGSVTRGPERQAHDQPLPFAGAPQAGGVQAIPRGRGGLRLRLEQTVNNVL